MWLTRSVASKTVTRAPDRSLSRAIVEHLLALVVDILGLGPEGAVVGDLLVERPGVLGETEGGEGTDLLLEIARVVGRVRDRHGRFAGFDVDRRHVERDVLVGLGEHDPGQPADLHPGDDLEVELDPIAELAGLEVELGAVDVDHGAARFPVDIDGERQLHGRVALEEGVLGAPDGGFVAVVRTVAAQVDADPALLEGLFLGTGGEEHEAALGAEEIGDAHGAELRAVELVGRKGDGHPDDGAPDIVLAEDRPPRFGFAQQTDFGFLQRDPELADLEELLHRTDIGRAQPRKIGPRVTVEEVEDVVPTRVGSGTEGGPRHRGDRRKGGAELAVAAAFGELGEVGQLALGHHPFGDPRVLAVEPDKNRAFDQGFGLPAVADHPPEGAERPGENRHAGQDHGHENHREGTQDREAGARTDVGIGGGGCTHHEDRQGRCDPDPGPAVGVCCRRHSLRCPFVKGG